MRAVIAGIGNMYRGDDGLGPEVVSRLLPELPDDVTALSGLADPLELIDVWDGVDVAVLVDAMVSGARPGSIHVFEVDGPLPAILDRLSTHVFSIAQVIEMGRALGRLPKHLVVVGAEAVDVRPGPPHLSAPVAASLDEIVDIVRRTVGSQSAPTTEPA